MMKNPKRRVWLSATFAILVLGALIVANQLGRPPNRNPKPEWAGRQDNTRSDKSPRTTNVFSGSQISVPSAATNVSPQTTALEAYSQSLLTSAVGKLPIQDLIELLKDT